MTTRSKRKAPTPGDPLSVAIAHRTIGYHPDLSSAEKVVATVILGHYNSKDGQCDPSGDRLVELSGLSRATVFRAIARLDELGLIRRKSYGGKAHRNSYEPNWRALNRIPAATVEAEREPYVPRDGEPFAECDINETSKRNKAYALRRKGSPPRAGRKGQARRSESEGQHKASYRTGNREGSSRRDAAEAKAQRNLTKEIAKLPDAESRRRAWLKAMDET